MFKNLFFKEYIYIVLLLSASLFSVFPLFLPGFFPMHDNTQVARIFEMTKSLKDGLYPVRWVADLGYGYGYPIFNFYAPLVYYIGSFLMLIGFDALLATKITMAFGMLLAGISMYFFSKQFFGQASGVVAALFYVYAPYHALDMYVRGDIAEVWAYAIVPFVFYSLWKAYTVASFQIALIGGITFAALILSHNLTALMAAPFLIIFALMLCAVAFRKHKIKNILFIIGVFFLGLVFSAFYWLPVFLEMHYTNVLSQTGGSADFHNHFVCPLQLWDSPWGFGGSTSGCTDGMSFKIGKLHIIFAAVALILSFFLQKERSKAIRLTVWTTAVGFLLVLLLTLEVAKPFWETMPGMSFFQYPWRFLIFLSFFSSFLAGAATYYIQKKIATIKKSQIRMDAVVISIVMLLLYAVNKELFRPQTIFNAEAKDFTNKATLIWTTSKISDEYLPVGFGKPHSLSEIPKDSFRFLDGSGSVTNVIERTNYLAADIQALRPSIIAVRLAVFPSWQFYLNGERFFPKTKQGMYIIPMVKGKYTLRATFQSTLPQRAGNAISFIGIIVSFVGIIYQRRKYYGYKST